MPRTGRPPVPFDQRVDRSAGTFGCWLWTGARDAKGYGHVWFHGRAWRAHRVAWIRANGRDIPTGMVVCHSCDVRACVNPTHLFAATQAANVADMDAKGRRVTLPIPDEARSRGDEHWTRRRPDLVLRGERNGRAKLTDVQVAEIRTRYRAGSVSQSALAREFGISSSRAQQIVSG